MSRPAHPGWVFVKRTRDGEDIDEIWRYRGSEITIRFGEAGDADLHGTPAEIEQAMDDAGGSITAWVRSPNGARFVVEDVHEDNMTYGSRDEAFAEVGKIADIIADAPSIRMPVWSTEDIPKYLKWFQTQSPNQANYISLFESNDKNGSFTGLFLEPLSASEEVFRDMFADDLGSTTRSAAAIAALAKINRARERGGEKPLDPDQAGWSDDDLIAEAKRVRGNPHASSVVPGRMYLYRHSGESSYFHALERLKNGGWKGTLVRDHGRNESRGPLKHIVDKYTIEQFHEIPLSDVPEPSRRRFEKAGLTFPGAAAASNPTQRMAARLARGHSR